MHTILAFAACAWAAVAVISDDDLDGDLLPAGFAEVRDGGSRQQAREQQTSEAVRTPFFRCFKVGHFCDLTRNLRAVVAYESTFAHQYLSRMKFEKVMSFFRIFNDLQRHIRSNNQGCPEIELPRAYMDRTIKEHINEDPYNFGKLVANYVNAPDVGFKTASDAIVDAGKIQTTPKKCSWTQGEVGLGRELETLKARVRNKTRFMWGMGKGRGDTYDKNAMLTGLPKSLITARMASHFEKKNKLEQKKASFDQIYEQMTPDEQQKLSRDIRWGQGFMNRYFGLFNFGDGDELHEPYFYKKIVHGGGIHGRNLSEGNPAARMLDFGMPWIGGVSGSVVDFYLLAKALNRSGSELAEAVVIDIACLVAGHQHSLGELLFAAAMTEREDESVHGKTKQKTTGKKQSNPSGTAKGRGQVKLTAIQDKSAHGKTEQKPPQRIGQFDPSANGKYFASDEMQRVVDVMNWPEKKYQKWLAMNKDKAFPMYEAAISEFIGRAVDFDFPWEKFAPQKSSNTTDEMSALLEACFRHKEAAGDFEGAVMRAGGYKDYKEDGGEDNGAWVKWVDLGTNGEGDLMFLAEWLQGIKQFSARKWAVHAETAAGNNATLQATWLRKRETNLLDLWQCLDSPQINDAFKDQPNVMKRSIFKEFYRLATYRS